MSIGAVTALAAATPDGLGADALGGIGGLGGLGGAAGVTGAPGAQRTPSVGSVDFGEVLSGGLRNLDATQKNADSLAVQAATGDLKDVHDYTMAATQAQLTTELTVTLRNKALDAFTEIMRMQG